MAKGYVYSISVNPERGRLKQEIPEAVFIEDYGIEGDGHVGAWGRQVTCLDKRRVDDMNREHRLEAGPGDFAENVLLDGLDLSGLTVGCRLKLGADVILEVTQIGKEDHPSVVTKTFGVSLLPYEGLFCRVIKGGRVSKGEIAIIL
jgi:MOSC domain-containing protein YiiM